MNKLLLIAALALTAMTTNAQHLKTNKGFISFYSEGENITATNEDVTSKLNTADGTMVFSVPVQSFKFEKALMQKHFNEEGVMNSQEFPKAKFKGKIDNLGDIDLSKDGVYDVTVTGDLTIKDQTHPVTEKGTVTVKNGAISADSSFNLDRFAWGVNAKKKFISQNLKIVVKMIYE